MRIHHLNCGTMCPWGGRLMDGRKDRAGEPARVVCHCLLIETNDGLVLGAISALLCAVTLLAAYLPARSAAETGAARQRPAAPRRHQ